MVLAGGGLVAGAALVLVIGLGVLRLGSAPASSDGGQSSGGSTGVGTSVGQLAPDFRLVDVDGRTVTRDSLRGEPALLWFTTSYCVPCQEGAKRLQRVLDQTGTEGRVKVVMLFVDPGEPASALQWWKSQFGRPDWTYGLASQAMVRDYRLQYLDTKYLLDRGGVIRAADFYPLDEAQWARYLTLVVGG